MHAPSQFEEYELFVEQHVPTWIPLLLRVVAVGLVARPALSKFLSYAGSVEFFTRLGIPNPEMMVLASGVVEVVAVALLLFGVANRIAALSLIPVMAVAVAYAGLSVTNVAVLLACIGIVAVGGGESGFLFTGGGESASNEDVNNESAENESVRNENERNESVGNEGVRNESVGNEGVRNESVDGR